MTAFEKVFENIVGYIKIRACWVRVGHELQLQGKEPQGFLATPRS
jgi:hypothetical protein